MPKVNNSPDHPGTNRTHLLGFPVDSLSMDTAVSRVTEFLNHKGLHHVVAINANKLWLAERMPELKRIVQNAELVIPEYAVVWACAFLRRRIQGHVGGVMLLKALLPVMEREQVPVYFLGAKAGVLALMKAKLGAAYPGLRIAGMRSGYFQSDEEEQVIAQINASGAKLLFVAMGTPRQELWIERHRHILRARVAMGVGGSFDVLAGVKKDAPNWLRHGGEWIYRLAQDPKNLWKRYLTTNPWFIYRVVRERIFSNQA